MPKYRKKPVVIEAVQWTGENATEMSLFIGRSDIGRWYNGTLVLPIETLEGQITANPGDWVIKGVKGEFYPCKPDIFDATYDLVEAQKEPTK